MSHSVRISDELHELLQRNAQLMHRSIGQQLEFLARLGHEIETSPFISAKQLRLLMEAARRADAGSEVSDERFEAAFSELAQMDGNPVLQQRLTAAGRPLAGRKHGDLVEQAPQEGKHQQAD